MDKEKRKGKGKGKGKDLFGRFLTATEDGCVSSASFDEELKRIPETQKRNLVDTEKGPSCYRSRISKMHVPYRLTDIENKVGVLFERQEAILNKKKPTFVI